MSKYLYFFLGLFIASIFSVMLAYGVAKITVEQIKDSIAYIFIVTSFLFFLLTTLILFRSRILKFFNIRVNVTIENMVSIFSRTLSDAIDGNAKATVKNSEELAKVAVAWYSWTNFYRWVIGTGIALLIAFTGLAGTALLIEQNRRLKTQNELIQNQNDIQSVSLGGDLRNPFLNAPALTGSSKILIGDYSAGKCTVTGDNSEALYRQPSEGEISSILYLVDNTSLKERVIDLLKLQLKDSHPTVALGALLVLDRLKMVPENTKLNLHKMFITDLKLNSKVEIWFYKSKIFNIDCKLCELNFRKSSVFDPGDSSLANIQYSLVTNIRLEKIKNAQDNIFDFKFDAGDYKPNIEALEKILRKNYWYPNSVISKNVSADGDGIGCKNIEGLCDHNPFLKCTGLDSLKNDLIK